jgi:ABC-type multidrug transport system ATPase subunit
MLEVNKISKSYNGQKIFSDLSFDIQEGEILGITGRNGSGKSTLLKILSKIAIQDFGEIIINPDINVDYLGHENMFFGEMSIKENIDFFTKFENIEKSEKNISELKNLLGLELIYTKKINELSYGQAKKSGLYRIVLSNSDLILLDEPFSGLDTQSVENLTLLINKLKLKKKTLIISSNIIEIIENISDKLVNMDDFNE